MVPLQYKLRQQLFSHKIVSAIVILIVICGWMFSSGTLPFAVRSVTVPLRSRMEQITGTIQEKQKTEDTLYSWAKRGKKIHLMTVIFEIDSYKVRVPIEAYQDYKKGDSYSFMLYQMENGDIRTHFKGYDVKTGVFLILLWLICTLAGVWLICGKDMPEEEAVVDKLPRSYVGMGNHELLHLCEKWKIEIPAGKRKNRRYIENSLRQKARCQSDRRDHRKSGWVKILLAGYILIVYGSLVNICSRLIGNYLF